MDQNINLLAPNPPYDESVDITNVRLGEPHRFGTGDMWPLTLGPNGVIYGAAGDNYATKEINTWSPMNFWSIRGNFDHLQLDVVNNLPVDPAIYCRGENIDRENGVKPAGLIYYNGKLYLCVENMNYGDLISFNRQHNINGWIMTSDDLGVTWSMATEQNYFTGRLASCHFLNAGYDTENIIDGYIWAYFPCGLDTDDSWWCNGDGMLLGRVPPEQCGMCGHCTHQFVVEGNGNVYPCDFYCTDEWLLGNINETELKAMAESEKAKRFITESLKIDPKCRSCKYFPLCRGGGCKRQRLDDAHCEAFKTFFSSCLPLFRVFGTKN